jgi:hypothetical protein
VKSELLVISWFLELSCKRLDFLIHNEILKYLHIL